MNILSRVIISGSVASILSAAVIALRSRHDHGSAIQGANDISHWVWGDEAYTEPRPRWKFTAPGLLIHSFSSIFWAYFYEKLLSWQQRRNNTLTPTAICGSAAAITALANVVDFKFTPSRLTPGFEKHLTKPSLALVYLAFGVGLAMTAQCRAAQPRIKPVAFD